MTNPDFGLAYNTGTITVAVDDTVVVGSGTAWSMMNIREGDWISDGNTVNMISEVTDDTHLSLVVPWAGQDVTAGAYFITKMSASRYDPAITQQQTNELLAFLRGVGIIYYVTGATPDPGIGGEGQYAIKINAGAWTFWYKTGGVWVLQGSPAGINWKKGGWSSVVTYSVNDSVQLLGKAWISLQANNLNHSPASENLSNPVWWDLLADGGDRYDLANFDTDRPASGELILKVFPYGVTFYAGLVNSQAGAEVAATASAVFSIKKNNTQFATLTFGAGQTTGVFACAADVTFGAGDVLKITAPSPRDATLSGVAATLIGYRGG